MTINGQKVALHTSSGVQIFNGIDAFTSAHNAASNGDTIYLSGGTFNAPSAITKKLYIYGAGHYNDSTQVTGKTFIKGDLTLRENTDGIHIEGIDFTNSFILAFNIHDTVNNINIAYSKISGSLSLGSNANTYSNNFLLLNSVVVGGIDFTHSTNAAVLNSIIQGKIDNSNRVNYENNILFYSYPSAQGSYYYTINGNNNIIKNNIFFTNQAYTGVNGDGNQLYNNLFTSSNPNFGSSSTAIGNYTGISVNNIFVSNTLYVFDYASDYHLKYPDTYTGTDDTEVGIYGGTYPYKEGAVPSNPHFQYQNIGSASTSDGKLHIDIKAAAQDR